MTTSGASTPGPPTPSAIRLDIQRVTLDGYSPGRRDHFGRGLQARLAAEGAPEAAARQAAEAILAAIDARTGTPGD